METNTPPTPGVWRGLSFCVAICTCDRPDRLRDLLSSLERQTVGARFPIVIADNGRTPASSIAEEFRDTLAIRYARVEDPGLTPVRNQVIAMAKALGVGYMACVDDDEQAEPDWLERFMDMAAETPVDLVVGMVEPVYPQPTPQWVIDGGFFTSNLGPTTANLLIRLDILGDDESGWFHPDYAFTGGEDAELIKRLQSAGARFDVNRDACVLAPVARHRMSARHIWNRGLRDGVFSGREMRDRQDGIVGIGWAALRMSGMKVLYGVNHVFWSFGARWRAYRSLTDFGTAVGIWCALAGIKFHLYGNPPARRENRPMCPDEPATH